MKLKDSALITANSCYSVYILLPIPFMSRLHVVDLMATRKPNPKVKRRFQIEE